VTPALAVYAGLILARVGAFVAVVPPFGGQAPRLVRAGFAVVLAAFYLGAASPGWDPALAARAADVHPVVYAVALVREALIGVAMGFAFGLFLLPARVAGEFVTQQVGLTVSPSVGPTGTDSSGQVSRVFETVAALVFLVADGHHLALAALHATFDRLPLGGGALPTAGPMAAGLSSAYEMGLLLAGPLALCLFLLSVTLAVMTRAAPQLNIYSVGFSLQALAVLLGGLFLMPEMVRTMLAITARTGANLPHLFAG
jgi:flagellar biosynthetic protein FliR